MGNITEKIRYLQGLADGANLDDKKPDGKILTGILEVLAELSEQVEDLVEFQNELETEGEELVDSLSFLEDVFGGMGMFNYDDDDDEDEEEDDELYEVLCEGCGRTYLADFDDFDSDSVICPFCGEHYHFDEELLAELKETDEYDG